MNPIRLLLVTHFYPEHGSGIEIVAGTVAGRLANRGVEIEWAASASSASSASGSGRDRGIVRLPMAAWNWTETHLGVPYPIWSPAGLMKLSRAVARCDAVHLHDCLYFGNVAAYLLACAAGKPVLVTQHVGLVPYRSRVMRTLMALANRILGRLVLAGADQVVFISKQVQDYFERRLRFRRPPAFIPNGVDTAIFRPLSETERVQARARLGWSADRPVMLFVGRFVEKKGLALVRELAGRTPEWMWALVGRGPEDPTTWGLPNVMCLGSLPHREIAACYQAADLLVLPSVGEGFPLVVQEAMACGTPALVGPDTARGSPDAESVIFTAELSANALEAKLRETVPALAEHREGVATFARDRWDWERCADDYLQLFRSIL